MTMTATARAATSPVSVDIDAGWVHWALRLSIAATFLYHGLTKFPDLAGGADMFGLPVPVFLLVAVGEVLIPVALVLGGLMRSRLGDLFTRLGAAGAIVILLGAIILVHWGQWSFAASETHPAGGMEFQVSQIAMALYLMLRGNRA